MIKVLKEANLCMSREQTKRSGVGFIPFEVLKDLDIASDWILPEDQTLSNVKFVSHHHNCFLYWWFSNMKKAQYANKLCC